MFTIPDEVMGNIQKAFDSIQEKAYVHLEDIIQLQEYFPRIIEYILKARFEDAKDIYGLQAIASQEFVALFVSFVMSERISILAADVATMNKIAANLQISRQKAYDNIAELEAIIEKMKSCGNCKSHINVGSKCLLDIEDSLECRANNYSNWKLKDNE